MKLPDCDLMLISSSGFAHHAPRRPDVPVLVYCHTPPRFLWRAGDYFGDRRTARTISEPLLAHLRKLDLEAAAQPAQYLSNSRTTEGRIATVYQRQAPVVYPPVSVDRFQWDGGRDEFYLVVSRLLDYKRIDLAVEACTRLERRLVVIGDGPGAGRLREVAGPTVEFRGELPDEEVTALMQTCRAFIFPGEEDFGISPVEAMAAGAPVIAFNRAGSTETVIDGETGVLFEEQTVEAVCAAIERIESREWSPQRARERAEEFRPERFAEGLRRHVDDVLAGRAPGLPAPVEDSA